jgi:hypothetical protein
MKGVAFSKAVESKNEKSVLLRLAFSKNEKEAFQSYDN